MKKWGVSLRKKRNFMKLAIYCIVLAGLLSLPGIAGAVQIPDSGPVHCPDGYHRVQVCTSRLVCLECWFTGPLWHRVKHCNEKCPGGQICITMCDTQTTCEYICELDPPGPTPDPTPTPEPTVSPTPTVEPCPDGTFYYAGDCIPIKKPGSGMPFSEPIWSEYGQGCFLMEGDMGILPVQNQIIDVHVDYGSELDGFMVKTMTPGEVSCHDPGFYNRVCSGTRLYGSSSGGLGIHLVNPAGYLEVLAVKNSPERSLPMVITIHGSNGLYFRDETIEQVYYRKWTVPDYYPGCGGQ